MTAPAVEAFAVVVPVHDEEELLGACLRSLAAAVAACEQQVLVVTVLDRCADASARVAAEAAEGHPQLRLRVVEGIFPHLGEVRSAGVREAAAQLPDFPAERIWTAHTDADSRVPAQWLSRQAALAADGADLVIGTVVPEEDPASPSYGLWHARHRLEEGHAAVHGANLGVRLNRLLAVGGFSPLPVSEDVDTVRRLQAAGVPWVATDSVRVVTSARREGRAAGGFSRYMRDLDALAAGAEL